MRPILWDSAKIVLQNDTASFEIGYRTTTNLLGQEKKVLDIIDRSNSEVFSVFADVVFAIQIVESDPRIITRVGEKLIAYEKFGRSETELEPDGDKRELTPLGYFGYYVAKDGNTFKPYYLSPEPKGAITEFKDYFGFGSYTDDADGSEHFVLLIEDILSDPIDSDWYFVNNFIPDSETLDFPGTAEIKSWKIEGNNEYIMTLSDGKDAYIAESGAVVMGRPPGLTAKNVFAWIRHFEDTDSDIIVGKNEHGVFLIDRKDPDISSTEIAAMRYYKEFVGIQKGAKFPLFLLEDFDGTVVILDSIGSEIGLGDFEANQRVM